METNLEVLNKISQKLGGSADATSVTESLNNIANALGDTNPDVIKSVSDSLNDILEYAGGGGGTNIHPVITVKCINNVDGSVYWDAPILKDGNVYIDEETPLYTGVGEIELQALAVGNFSEEGYNIYCPYNASTDVPTASDEINCTLEGGETIVVTDVKQDASITLTFDRSI